MTPYRPIVADRVVLLFAALRRGLRTGVSKAERDELNQSVDRLQDAIQAAERYIAVDVWADPTDDVVAAERDLRSALAALRDGVRRG